jgi:hypothetical protein
MKDAQGLMADTTRTTRFRFWFRRRFHCVLHSGAADDKG